MRAAILIISDRSSRGEREDRSGPTLREELEKVGWEVKKIEIVPDEIEEIIGKLEVWTDSDEIDLVLTSGGTGFSARDVAPEATLAVVERLAPGLSEAMRASSLSKTPHAMLSRAVAGIRRRTLIVNLPGSPIGAKENLDVILPALPHAVQLLQEDPGAERGHIPPRPQPTT